MPEIIDCPSCRRKLQAPESVLGQDVQCPTCGTTFVASFGAPPAPPPPREAAPPAPPPPEGRRDRRPARRGAANDYGLDDEEAERGRNWGGDRADDWGTPRGRRDQVPHRGGAILTLGILALVGLLVCLPSLVLGPIAWAMGSNDLTLIRTGRMDSDGQQATASGQTCGIIATILGIIGVIFLCMSYALNHRGSFGRNW